MARVFVSHAGADVAATELVYRWLADDDHEVFLDRHPHSGIAPGDEWTKRLHERLRWADAVVVRGDLGLHARSNWCAAEVTLARSRGALVLPVRAEAGVRHPLLADLQEIDATRDPQDAHRRLTGRLVSLYGAPLAVPDDLEPFPGLLPFDADRHRIFFGREADVQRLADALRSPAERADAALFVLVGPSGCGKSSLVRAGLLPTVAREPDQFSLTPIVPGQDPAGAVFRELAEAGTRTLRLPGWSIEHVRQRVAANGLSRVLDELLLAVPRPRRTRVILVVDQFEQLLTRTSASACKFAELVGPALAGSLQVVTTLRPEFLDPLLACGELADLPKRVHTLAPMSPAALRLVIEKPARSPASRWTTDWRTSWSRTPAAARRYRSWLGTLAQLAEGVKRGGRLTLARYDQLGRVTGALVRQADEALAEAVRAGGRDRAAVIRSLMRLVHVDGPAGRRASACRAPSCRRRSSSSWTRSSSGGCSPRTRRRPATPTTGTTGGWSWGSPRGSPDRLAPADRRGPAGPGGLPRAAPAGAGRPALGGLPTTAIAPVVRVPAHHCGRRRRSPAALGHPHDRADRARQRVGRFLRASMLRVRRARRALSAVLVVLTLVMTVSGGVALWQRQLAAEQRQIAVARQLLSDADVARESDVRQALMLGVAARELNPGPEADTNLLDTLASTAYSRTIAGVPVVRRRVAGRAHAGARPDRRTGDAVGPCRPAEPASARRTARCAASFVYDLEFSTNGPLLAVTGGDRTIGLWDVAVPTSPRPWPRSVRTG